MGNTEQIVVLVAVAVVALVLLYWAIRLASLLLASFTILVFATPWWIVVPGFIIFPPVFVAFLIGIPCVAWEVRRANKRDAVAQQILSESSGQSLDCDGSPRL